MKIAIRNGKGSEWKRIPNGDQQKEGGVRSLIYQIPELISTDDLGSGTSSLKVCIKAPSIGNPEGSEGLIGIDEKGKISIIECKIPDNSVARREVMGQALEYAANLWEKSYEEFDSLVMSSEGKPLVELMKERVPADGWSEEEFKNAVVSSLYRGDFRLIIVVVGMTEDLMRTIKFMNARGPFSFETYALEIQYFSDGQVDIAVPRLTSFSKLESRNPTLPSAIVEGNNFEESDVLNLRRSVVPSNPTEPNIANPKQGAGKIEHKESLFFNKCQEGISENAVETIKKLYSFSRETADDIIWWGSGGAGAFNFVLTEDGLTVFIVDANGKIMFNFSEWQREPSYRDLLPQFIEKLKGITTLRKQKEDYTRWPDFSVEEFFSNPEDFKTFEESIKFLKEELSKMTFL